MPSTASKLISLAILSCSWFGYSESLNMSDLTFTMSDKNEARYWRSVNDNVMGGVSQGGIRFDGEYTVFFGKISLENNGGFSSVTRQIPQLPANIEQITLDVTGDGKTYQLRLNTILQGYRIGYRQKFQTQANQRLTIKLAIKDFIATYRGRIISDAPELGPELVKEVGFLISNKKAEAFKLKIHQIEFN